MEVIGKFRNPLYLGGLFFYRKTFYKSTNNRFYVSLSKNLNPAKGEASLPTPANVSFHIFLVSALVQFYQ
jgi:hypothetical protein